MQRSADPPDGPRRPPACALVVFAKAPVPGAVKTRLVPPLTPEQAARLHQALVDDTLRRIAALPWPRYLACAPTARDPFLAACARRHGARAIEQGAGDLGARMRRVSRALLRRHAGVIVLGTDSPTLPLAYLEQARAALGRSDLVLGPTEDGGYYLLGQRRLDARIFTRMPWGTGRVLAITLRRVGSAASLLPPWYDVDRPSDLERLRGDLAAVPTCEATASLLASWPEPVESRASGVGAGQP